MFPINAIIATSCGISVHTHPRSCSSIYLSISTALSPMWICTVLIMSYLCWFGFKWLVFCIGKPTGRLSINLVSCKTCLNRLMMMVVSILNNCWSSISSFLLLLLIIIVDGLWIVRQLIQRIKCLVKLQLLHVFAIPNLHIFRNILLSNQLRLLLLKKTFLLLSFHQQNILLLLRLLIQNQFLIWWVLSVLI